jgi:hypothetical protein
MVTMIISVPTANRRGTPTGLEVDFRLGALSIGMIVRQPRRNGRRNENSSLV